MPVQTDYSATHVVGYEGSVVDNSLNNIGTKIAEDSDIGQGIAVVRGAGDNGATIATATGGEFVGITTSTTAGEADGSDNFLYLEDSAVNVLDTGKIYGFCEDGCSPGDAVFFIHTGANQGKFRTDLDTDKADEIVGATFESTATAGNIAVIKLG